MESYAESSTHAHSISGSVEAVQGQEIDRRSAQLQLKTLEIGETNIAITRNKEALELQGDNCG